MSTLISKASLLMVPSVYEDGTLYNVLPSGNKAPDETGNHNGYDQTRADFTFSRGSNLAATRVNASGLIEKGRENLLLQSNQFDTTWDTSGVITLTSGQADKDGGTDAWKLAKGSASAFLYQSNTTNAVQTFSMYAKADTSNWIMFQVSGIASVRTFFDLGNGVLGSSLSNVIDSKIESVGNGWYRCSMTYNGNPSNIRVFVADGNNDTSGTSGSVFIMHSQNEQSLVATDYLETGATTATAGVLENTPRIDYSSGAGALLLEPQRTNVLPHSEYFGLFNTLNGASITSNYSVSPEGVTNATRVLLDAQSQSRIETPINTGTTIANNNQTISCWVKSNGADTEFRLKCTHSSVLDYYSPNLTATSEWQRFTFTQLFGAGSSTTITAGILNSTANNAADLSIYGMQLEVNLSYPSSYVPTYGSAATRSFDNATTTSEEDVLTSGEGVVFMEFEIDDTTITGYPEVIRIENPSDTTDKFWFYIFDDSDAGEIRFGYRLDDTAVKKVEGSVTLDTTTTAKVAMRLENNNYALYYNGTKQTPTQYAGVVSNLRKITTRGREHFNGLGVKQFAIFNEALSDSELATLTTL